MTMFRLPIFVWTMLVTSVLGPVCDAGPHRGADRCSSSTATSAATSSTRTGRQPDPLAEPLLVLLAPGGLHHDPAGDGHHLRDPAGVLPQAPLRLQGDSSSRPPPIGALGFSVWAHHMFTTGAVFLPFFSLTTMLIAVPTGVKMFNWLGTMWRGKLSVRDTACSSHSASCSCSSSAASTACSAPPSRSTSPLHDTYWVVAHIHYVLFGGSVFGVFAGIYYWFPKMTGPDVRRGARRSSTSRSCSSAST